MTSPRATLRPPSDHRFETAGRFAGYAFRRVMRGASARGGMKVSVATSISDDAFTLLVQSVVDYAIYMLDTTGKVTSWNAGAERIKGYSTEEILGQHFSRFYTDEDRAAEVPKTALETARATGRYEAEGWRVRKDGTRFWASVVIDAIKDRSGKLVGFAKVTRDMTEKR